MASTTGDWMIEQHICRCCHSEGKFKSLISTDPVMEDELLYFDALRFCLDVELCLVEGSLAYAACTICETCVSRLQEACSFRRQVLSCEGRFQTLYSQNRIKGPIHKNALNENIDYTSETELEQSNLDISLTRSNLDKSPTRSKVSISEDHYYDDVDNVAINVTIPSVISSEPVVIEDSSDPDGSYLEDNHDSDVMNSPCIEEKPEEKKKTPKPRGSKKRGGIQREPKPKKITYRLCDSDYERTGDKFKCTRCNSILHSIKILRQHIKTYHLLMYTYKCTLCDKSFITKIQFVKHKLDEHNIDDRFKCNACDKVFNAKRQLSSHKNSFHMLGEKMKCPQCDYECYNDYVLKRHMIRHTTVKDHHCKYCKKSFLRKTNLEFHERIHTGDKRKVCAECGQAFVQKAGLNYHMVKCHPEVNY